MPSRDTSTERRLLTRLLEHEEQDSVLEQALPQDAQAAQALLDSLLEQAEPQDAEEVRLSSKFKTHRTKRGGGQTQDEEEQAVVQKTNPTRPGGGGASGATGGADEHLVIGRMSWAKPS